MGTVLLMFRVQVLSLLVWNESSVGRSYWAEQTDDKKHRRHNSWVPVMIQIPAQNPSCLCVYRVFSFSEVCAVAPRSTLWVWCLVPVWFLKSCCYGWRLIAEMTQGSMSETWVRGLSILCGDTKAKWASGFWGAFIPCPSSWSSSNSQTLISQHSPFSQWQNPRHPLLFSPHKRLWGVCLSGRYRLFWWCWLPGHSSVVKKTSVSLGKWMEVFYQELACALWSWLRYWVWSSRRGLLAWALCNWEEEMTGTFPSLALFSSVDGCWGRTLVKCCFLSSLSK